MAFKPYEQLPGGFSPTDGTIDFYARVSTLIDAGSVVLDLGAGRAGWYEDDSNQFRRDTRLLKGRAAKVIAVDVDCAVLENKSADECFLMKENQIPLADESVDLIIADYVLEHIEDPLLFFHEINRVLKKGGKFCARTPHKINYVSVFALLIKNTFHSKFLKKVQPNRKEMDVFPTAYKMNTKRDLKRLFIGYDNRSFIFRADPEYYFGSQLMFMFLKAFHCFLPSSVCGNLFVFLQKTS